MLVYDNLTNQQLLQNTYSHNTMHVYWKLTCSMKSNCDRTECRTGVTEVPYVSAILTSVENYHNHSFLYTISVRCFDRCLSPPPHIISGPCNEIYKPIYQNSATQVVKRYNKDQKPRQKNL